MVDPKILSSHNYKISIWAKVDCLYMERRVFI